MRRRSVLGMTILALPALACGALTREEARESLEELKLSSQAQALASGTVEIGTNFSIGAAADAAANELRSFVQSQLPCAEVELSESQLSIEYGAREGTCTHRGQAYAGSHFISVSRNEMSEVVVDHVWDGLRNDTVQLDGTATVTWSMQERTRHVVHSTLWTRLSDGRTGEGTGDRLQQPLDEGLFTGFSVDGVRSWHGASGDWSLEIDEVSMRWVDPIPESGRYTLETPFGKTLTAVFDRSDATTIQVEMSSGSRAFDFQVTTPP